MFSLFYVDHAPFFSYTKPRITLLPSADDDADNDLGLLSAVVRRVTGAREPLCVSDGDVPRFHRLVHRRLSARGKVSIVQLS